MESKSLFPKELEIQILLQLPVKSLLRFKKVCKDWHYFIRSSNFSNQYIRKSNSKDVCKILCYREDPNTKTHVISIFTDKIGQNIVDLEWPPFMEVEIENKAVFHRGIVILGPVNGIYCIFDRLIDRWFGTLILWNPATKEYKHILPPISLPFASKLIHADWNPYTFAFKRPTGLYIGFGFDDNTDDFKIVVITHWVLDYDPTDFQWHVRVYNLSIDSWRTIYYLSRSNMESSPFRELIPSFPHIQSEPEFAQSLLKGVYHWPCYCMFPENNDGNEGIILFDMVDESFQLMKGPPYSSPYNCRSVWVIKDTIVMVVSSPDFWVNPWQNPWGCYTVGVWMMMEYGMHDSWAMVRTFGPMVGLTFIGALDDDQFFFQDAKNQLISSSITANDQFKEHGVYGLRESLDIGINESLGVLKHVETLVPLKLKDLVENNCCECHL